MAYRRFLVVGLGLALSACGGKDRVIGSGPPAGGASGSAGTTGSGGSAGSGGSTGGSSGNGATGGAGATGGVGGIGGIGGGAGGPTACNQMTESGPPLRINGTPLEHETKPQLLPPRTSTDPVTLTYATLAAEGPKQVLPQVSHATLDPLQAWPKEFFGTGYLAMPDGGFDFVAGSGIGHGFAVLGRKENSVTPGPMLSGEVNPNMDNTTPPFDPATKPSIKSGPVRFITEGALGATLTEYLIGHEWPQHQLRLARVVWQLGGVQGGVVTPLETLGCATAPVFADAFYVPQHHYFILAVTTSRPPLGCGLDLYTDGPPTRVQVFRIPAQGTPVVTAEFSSSLPIDKFFLSPTADGGAWITWQGTGGLKLDSLHAARIDSSGAALTKELTLTDVEVAFPPIAATALGNSLAVAWTDAFDPSAPSIAIKVFDEKTLGNTPTHIFTPKPWFSMGDGLSITGSHAGNQLYVSWSSEITEVFHGPSGSTAAMIKRLFTKRLDCSAK